MSAPAFYPGQILGDVEILTGVLPDKPHYHQCRCRLCGMDLLLTANGIRAAEHGGCAACRKAAKVSAAETAARSALVGQRFGELLVLDAWMDHIKGSTQRMIVCRCCCDCGAEIVTPRARLESGGARTCGHNTPDNLAKGQAVVAAESVTGTRVSSLTQRLSKNNTSGYKGVSMIRRGRSAGMYRAYINFRRKQYPLGQFRRIEDAVAARVEAEERIYGDFLAWYNEHCAGNSVD